MHSSEPRGTTPRTLFKIVLMLGLALVGVAALAAEQPQTDKPEAACAMTRFGFDGRTVENGNVTDNWTLTCWRQPPQQAVAPAAKPVAAEPVATGLVRNGVRAPDAQF
jgi:hypothetical protein